VAILLWMISLDSQAALMVQGHVIIDPPPTELLRGQVGTIQYQVTNTGDEPLDTAIAGVEFQPWGPESDIHPYPTAATLPCLPFEDGPDPIPGQPPHIISMVRFDPLPLAPGDSRTCFIEFLVTQQAPDEFRKYFIFNGSLGNRVTPDHVLAVDFRLRGRIAEIPGNSTLGLVAMTCCILLIGMSGLNGRFSKARTGLPS